MAKTARRSARRTPRGGRRHAPTSPVDETWSAWSTARLWETLLDGGAGPEGIRRLTRWVDYWTGLTEFPHEALAQELGWDEATVRRVGAILELARRLRPGLGPGPVIHTPEDVYAYAEGMKYLHREHLRGIYLDTRHRVLEDRILSIGTVNMSVAHPREILAPVLKVRATAFLLVHNHPSGEAEPSPEDRRVTRQVVGCARLFDVSFLDHLIVARQGFFSFRRSTSYWQDPPPPLAPPPPSFPNF